MYTSQYYMIRFERLTGTNGAVAEIDAYLERAHRDGIKVGRILASPGSVSDIIAASLGQANEGLSNSELQLHYQDKFTGRRIPVVRRKAMMDGVLILDDLDELDIRVPDLTPRFEMNTKRKIRIPD